MYNRLIKYNELAVSKIPIAMFMIACIALGGCAKSASGEKAANATVAGMDSLPDEVRELVQAVMDNDSATFSSLVSYPLERPYPLHAIEDSTQMKSYYPVMVDDSLRRIITESAPEEWGEEGWRGWTVGDGSYLWIDGALYEVGYVSQEESHRRNDLVRREMNSLPAEMQGGWVPEWCLENPQDGTIYRIDADSLKTVSGDIAPGLYRLAIYRKNADLHKRPARTLRGHKYLEGSAGSVLYYFDTQNLDSVNGVNVAEIVIEPFSNETGTPKLYRRVKSKGNEELDYDLKRIYWLEQISKQDSIGR